MCIFPFMFLILMTMFRLGKKDADAVVDNFSDCPLRAAMCCFASDRQVSYNLSVDYSGITQ